MIATLCAAACLAPGSMPQLSAPVKIAAGGTPIQVRIGHLAPYVVDFDRDGKKDLLVGTFDGAVLRVYKNVGSDKAPRFAAFSLAKAQGQDMKGEAG